MRQRWQRKALNRWPSLAALLLMGSSLWLTSCRVERSQSTRLSRPPVPAQAQVSQSREPWSWACGALFSGAIAGIVIARHRQRGRVVEHAANSANVPSIFAVTPVTDRIFEPEQPNPSEIEGDRSTAETTTPNNPVATSYPAASDAPFSTGPADGADDEAIALMNVLFEGTSPDGSASVAATSVASEPAPSRPEASNLAIAERSELELALLQCMRDAVLILDDSLSIVDINPAAEVLFGYAPDDVLGRDALSLLFPTSERAQLRADARQLLSAVTGPWTDIRETNVQHADETLVLLEWSTHRIFLKGKPHILAFARDTSSNKHAEAALCASEERYDLAVRGSNDGLWDWDLADSQIEFSPRWKEMLGYQEREISTNPDEWFERVHPDDLDGLVADITAHIKGETEHFESEHRILKRDRTYMWVFTRGLAVRNERNFAYRLAGSQTDITERRKAEANAYRDALSDLPNRAALLIQLEDAVARANCNESFNFAVLFLDCDRFKVINDSLGHAVGDRLIQIVARRLEVCIRPLDMVARLGGDEFVVLLREIKTLEDATTIADRILQQIVQPFRIDGHEVFITASIGIVSSDIGHRRADTILRDADTAMYRAKALGKSRYVVFDESMYSGAVQRQRIESDLRRAFDNGEFHLAYQPIVSVETEHLSGFEALLRWKHPERSWISPTVFIPIAEDMGLISEIGEWVLQQACEQMQAWHRLFPNHPLTISVNLASNQIIQPTFVTTVRNTIANTGCNARCLRIELTESALVENMDTACSHLQSLRSLGVQAYIDDFGTGYSSLSYLQTLPLDALKIDRSFISNTDSQPHSWKIVETIISLAQSLGIFTIAEGVETQEQFSRLRQLGCEYLQGYFISQPMDSQKATEFIRCELLSVSHPTRPPRRSIARS